MLLKVKSHDVTDLSTYDFLLMCSYNHLPILHSLNGCIKLEMSPPIFVIEPNFTPLPSPPPSPTYPWEFFLKIISRHSCLGGKVFTKMKFSLIGSLV